MQLGSSRCVCMGGSGLMPARVLSIKAAGSPWGAHYVSRDPKSAGRGGWDSPARWASLVSLVLELPRKILRFLFSGGPGRTRRCGSRVAP